MKRTDDSSNLGDLQAEGNLGNERVRNRPEKGMRERSRESEERERGEDWSPSSDVHDNNDARRGDER